MLPPHFKQENTDQMEPFYRKTAFRRWIYCGFGGKSKLWNTFNSLLPTRWLKRGDWIMESMYQIPKRISQTRLSIAWCWCKSAGKQTEEVFWGANIPFIHVSALCQVGKQNTVVEKFLLTTTTTFSRSQEPFIHKNTGGSTGKMHAKAWILSLCQIKPEVLPSKLLRVKLCFLIQIACGPADLGRLSWLSHISWCHLLCCRNKCFSADQFRVKLFKMLRQPEQLTGVSAMREHRKAVNWMALLNCGGIDGETSTDMLGWGSPKGICGYTMVALRRAAEMGMAGEANWRSWIDGRRKAVRKVQKHRKMNH